VPLTLLLADDHVIVRQGFRSILERAGFHVVAVATDGREALRLAEVHRPDVAILDVAMPHLNGLDAAEEILQATSRTAVIVLTMHVEEHQIVAAIRIGVRGYVVKTQPAEDLIQAIRIVAAGGTYFGPRVSRAVVDAYVSGGMARPEPLTSRERAVLQLVAEGRTSKEIAETLTLSSKTVETYRSRLMEKLEIHEIAGLVRYAIRQGMIQP
jgi:DNA-binding NarL/FixJ family response regulator